MRKGLVTIATGPYVEFVGPLVNAVRTHSMGERLFVLTDSRQLLSDPRRDSGEHEVAFLPCGRLPWPYPTLFRYSSILAYSEFLREQTDSLVYLDVDMKPVDACEALFGPEIVAVTHPGHWEGDLSKFPHCDDPSSRAYVPYERRKRYVCGGVQGGLAGPFLEAMQECADQILDDQQRGVMAKWHDESHWNRWVSYSDRSVNVLGPEYCWPESWVVPGAVNEPRLLALDKDHHRLRGTRMSPRERLAQMKGRVRGLARSRFA